MSEKVLIVDDEKEFLEALAERMRARGMEVTTATSPIEALALVARKSFDAIVLDFQMPELDGLETLKRMKESNDDVQVIVLTGHATIERGVEVMKHGAADFVEKSADINSLTEKIHEASAKKLVIAEEKTREKIQAILEEKGW
ncbi:response regulator [Oleidesulfovibrio sp.]|uniref:response regulator n=1 Tax=Oleidesulfovibrio sp. TaxID=2909707 RepID=UPI003A841B38